MTEKIVETKPCKQCGISFDITDKDREFYDKISPVFVGKKYTIPAPTFCPDCRQQRRLSFRNERKLYKRKCDLTGRDMVSIYRPDSKYTVYDQKAWRSDEWDPTTYGQQINFSESFFQQFASLFKKVPRIALNGHVSNKNSEYVNYVVQSKNCYMCFGGGYNENVCYSTIPMRTKDSCDVHFSFDCENCYEIAYCRKCFNVQYGYNNENCRDSYFIENCEGCDNCFGCDGLVNQSYCVYNEKIDPEAYKKIVEKYMTSLQDREEIVRKVQECMLRVPKKNLNISFSENCIGNHISHSKNCTQCYTAQNVSDSKFGDSLLYMENAYDVNQVGVETSWIYEIMTCSMQIHNCKFSLILRNNCANLLYCSDCNACTDCFGCIGLKNKQYCMLNTQYTQEEYESLVPQIIEHMEKNGERGEFFPSSLSPFGYNETVASEFYPLSKEEAIEKGFNRCDYEMPFPQVSKMITSHEIPDIKFVNDDILTRAIECEVTKKPFRIIKPELEFYRKHNIQIPHKHPDQRHKERMLLRNQKQLRDRKCAKCEINIKTTYSPEDSEIVYCEACYNRQIHG